MAVKLENAEKLRNKHPVLIVLFGIWTFMLLLPVQMLLGYMVSETPGSFFEKLVLCTTPFTIIWILCSHPFRQRMYGRGVIVHWLSMEYGSLFGFGAALAFLAGCLYAPEWPWQVVSGVAATISVASVGYALYEGPVYGWYQWPYIGRNGSSSMGVNVGFGD